MLVTPHELVPLLENGILFMDQWCFQLLDQLLSVTIYTMRLPFSGSREIHHFYCELPRVSHLSSGGTLTYEMEFLLAPPFLFLFHF